MTNFTETGHKKSLEKLVEGLTGRIPEFVYIKQDQVTNTFLSIVHKGKIPILIPESLIAYHEIYKENADYLEYLVALQAGRVMYGSAALTLDDFIGYHARLCKEGFIKQDYALWNIEDFFNSFSHRVSLAKNILEIIESARVNAGLKRDYLGFKQILDKVVPIEFNKLLDGFKVMPKQALDNTVLTLLQYKLLLGYLPEHKIKPKQGEHNTIRAAKKKGIIIKPFAERVKNLLDVCYDCASVILNRGADLGDSFIAAKQVHELIFKNTKDLKDHSSAVSPKKLKGLRGFDKKEYMIIESDLSELSIFKNKSFQSKKEKTTSFAYHEWDSIHKRFIKNFIVFEDTLRLSKKSRKLNPDANIVQKLNREFSLIKQSGRSILKKQRSGEIDYESFVEYKQDIAAGVTPDERVYKKVLNKSRDVAVLVLIDMSGSTNQWIDEETQLMDIIAESVYYLSCGASQLDDLVGVFGYSTFSRARTEFYTIADFGDACPHNINFLYALSRLEGRKQNHDGSAIRHAAKKLIDTDRKDKLLIHISDGEPEVYLRQKDLYGSEKKLPAYRGEYAWNDVRKALSECRAQGILPVCIRVNDQKSENLEKAYGSHYRLLSNPFDLQKVLCNTYKDLIS